MNRKLSIYALTSSPILALYGVSPLYIFGILTFEKSLMLFLGVFLSIALYWIVNIIIFFKLDIKNKKLAYFISYAVAFASKVFFLFFESFIVLYLDDIEKYVLYPASVTIAVNTIILIIISSVKQEQEKRKADQTIAQLTIQNLTAQKFTLMQQLQPHFLFNALSTLNSLIQENPDLAEDYSIKLSNFLRYSVESHNEELVKVKDEMQFVRNYIELQKVRFEESFQFSAEVTSELLEAEIPVFAIQTLVENAFKHNYFTNKNPLRIAITSEGGFLNISNNIGSLKLTNRAGTGLANLKKRYELYGKNNIKITSSETEFCVQIPIISHENSNH